MKTHLIGINRSCRLLRQISFPNSAEKFHAHLTVEISGDRVDDLKDLCKREKIKLTIVDLENTSGQSQTDVMTTSYYRDNADGAVARIAKQLADTSEALSNSQFKVIRAKLEHESLPSLDTFSETNYHEIHVKLLIPDSAYQETHQALVTIGAKKGFVPSRNPLGQKEEGVTQFINQRIFSGSHEQADEKISDMLKSIEHLQLSVIEVKRETVIFDTHQKLDQWWISVIAFNEKP